VRELETNPALMPASPLSLRPAAASGLALLLLVSLVMQLPALRVAESLFHTQQGERIPERLVSRPIVIQQVRQAQRETIKPAAVALGRVAACDFAEHCVPGVQIAGGYAQRLLSRYLDLPPPVVM
jgi:hypothetical protein